MSPSRVDSTAVSRTPRAAATYTRDMVRQAASACSRCSAGFGPVSIPSSTAGSPASSSKASAREVSSWPAPQKPLIVERLCAPPIQRLVARNWNRASSGCPSIASRVPNICPVSTPLRFSRSPASLPASFGCGCDDRMDAPARRHPRHRPTQRLRVTGCRGARRARRPARSRRRRRSGGLARHSELHVDVREVPLDGARAEEQPLCDLFIAQSLGHERDDVALAAIRSASAPMGSGREPRNSSTSPMNTWKAGSCPSGK